jgi:hypothetical protein
MADPRLIAGESLDDLCGGNYTARPACARFRQPVRSAGTLAHAEESMIIIRRAMTLLDRSLGR